MQLNYLAAIFLLTATLSVQLLASAAAQTSAAAQSSAEARAATKPTQKNNTPKTTPKNKPQKRPSLKAHVHDNGLLQIVTSGNTLHASLEIPSYNVFGFEHVPKTATQKRLVASKKKWLEKISQKFIGFDHELCKVSKTVVESSIDSQIETARNTHSDVYIKLHYECKRGLNDEYIKIHVIDHLQESGIESIRLNVLNDKFLPPVTISKKSYKIQL